MAPSENASKAETPSPVLCIWGDESPGSTTSRCFINRPVENERRLAALIGAAMPLYTLVRPHEYYVAVEWSHDDMMQHRSLDGLTKYIHAVLRDLFDLHFGWEGEYSVDYVSSSSQLKNLAMKNGMIRREWEPGWRY